MMNYEGICQNVSNQSSIHKIGKQLAILLTSSYLSFGYTNGIMLRITTAEGMKNLTQREAEFF